MSLLLGALALADEDRHGASDAAELARARALTRLLAHTFASRPPPSDAKNTRVVSLLLRVLGALRSAANVEHVDRALVLSAEHELNASTFAGRVAASAGADLYVCLFAAVSTLSGSAHG